MNNYSISLKHIKITVDFVKIGWSHFRIASLVYDQSLFVADMGPIQTK